MGTRVIEISLSGESIDSAIRQLDIYKKEVVWKLDKLRDAIADEIASEVQMMFNNSIVSDVINGHARKANVSVSMDCRGNTIAIIASGEDAVWVEFGAGVFHNGSSGSAKHPSGNELGFTIGSYGKGMGNKQTWGYYEDGNLVLTHGTPAIMPMYKSMSNICGQISSIARGIFK